MCLKEGQILSIHAYKHNGDLYRSWNNSIVLEDTEKYLVLVNENVTITEINGRKWTTIDPAIWLFFKNDWYNIICMIRNDGVHYYCNIASPFILDSETVKYIDYDLDVKVFPNRSYKLLDLKEFKTNRLIWKYPIPLQNTLWQNINKLKKGIKKREINLFNDDVILEYWKKYQSQSLQK